MPEKYVIIFLYNNMTLKDLDFLYILLLLLLLSRFSHVWLCATPEMAAHQAPPSLGFSRQEHWSGLPFPSPMHESEKWKWSRSVVSDSQRPHGLQPTRLLHLWDFPGKSTGVGCHCLHLCIFWKTLNWLITLVTSWWLGKWASLLIEFDLWLLQKKTQQLLLSSQAIFTNNFKQT